MNEVVYCTKCKNELSPRNTFCPICGKINTNNHTNNNNFEIQKNETNNIPESYNVSKNEEKIFKDKTEEQSLEDNGSSESVISVVSFTIFFLPYYLFVFLGPLIGALLFGHEASGWHLAVIIVGILIGIPTIISFVYASRAIDKYIASTEKKTKKRQLLHKINILTIILELSPIIIFILLFLPIFF